MSEILYCLKGTELCFSMEDWEHIAVISATYITVPSILVAAFKTWAEIKKNRLEREHENEQRDRDHLLKRIDFTLNQHRRLFDDPTLFAVLSLIDSDDEKLFNYDMWDPKRKLLTFFEEIALLVNSKQIDSEVAYYMFGYYAIRARDGQNFKEGIDLDEKYWGLFYEFSRKAELYIDSSKFEDIKTLKF